MFKRKYRLPWGVRFNNSYTFSAPQFIVKIKENKLLLSRFGIVVSKKIDKRAVARNRIKRLIYSSLQELYNNIKPGYDMLFIARIKATESRRKDFDLAIKQALIKQGLLI